MSTCILFVCLHGSAKSLIAAEYCRRLARERGLAVEPDFAGLEPDDIIPSAVEGALRADGFDVSGLRPRRPTADAVHGATAVVTFACDLGSLNAQARHVERWDDVPAVSQDFARARDVILGRVGRLLDSDLLRR